ncbi:hypothetical protein M3683_16835 [Metabacillus halosaccharovorans]|nr:hypothetical protein [Metabacillus halosaccharovorans]
MGFVTFLVVILVASIVDFLWLDTESKRWNWLKNRSKRQQLLFFLFFIGASSILYILFGIKFLNS